MIYKEDFKIALKDVGKDNKIKNKAIIEIFENIGAYHSDKVQYGANDIKRTGVTWVLLDWKVEVIKRPTYGEILHVHTWGRKMVKFYTYRDYEVYNEKGELCIIGTSKWILFDVQKRKIAKITENIVNSYEPEEKHVFLEEELDKIKMPENFTSSITYKVGRKDIDMIGHMHNLYYLDLAYEALPQEVYDQRPFSNFRINYKKEIMIEDTVICKYSKVENKHIVVIENKNKKIVHAIIELSKLDTK